MQDLKRLSKRLECMPAHDSLYLLRNVFTTPRLMYLLRTTCCIESPVLPLFDATIRDSLSATLNVELSDDRWRQASLPVRWGGLGVRSVISLAPSANLASAACTSELKSSLLPTHLREVEDNGVSISLSAWRIQSSSPPPSSTSSSTQTNWDDLCCKVEAETLFNCTPDIVQRARLIASCSPGSGDWLNALPLASAGLKRWITPQYALQPAYVLGHRLSVHMFVSAARWSRVPDYTACLVATARVDTLVTTKLTSYCVVPSLALARLLHVSHIPCARVMESVPMA